MNILNNNIFDIIKFIRRDYQEYDDIIRILKENNHPLSWITLSFKNCDNNEEIGEVEYLSVYQTTMRSINLSKINLHLYLFDF